MLTDTPIKTLAMELCMYSTCINHLTIPQLMSSVMLIGQHLIAIRIGYISGSITDIEPYLPNDFTALLDVSIKNCETVKSDLERMHIYR